MKNTFPFLSESALSIIVVNTAHGGALPKEDITVASSWNFSFGHVLVFNWRQIQLIIFKSSSISRIVWNITFVVIVPSPSASKISKAFFILLISSVFFLVSTIILLSMLIQTCKSFLLYWLFKCYWKYCKVLGAVNTTNPIHFYPKLISLKVEFKSYVHYLKKVDLNKNRT